MSKDSYSIEEYKFAKDKIRKNEEKRFALITLNLTAFSAILGFSENIDPLILPIALIAVLVVCSSFYTSQSIIQRHTTAFIIERYEIPLGIAGYEYGINEDRISDSGNGLYVIDLIKKTLNSIRDPFLLMCVVGLGSTIIVSSTAIFELFQDNVVYGALYIFFLFFLYMVVFEDAARRRSSTLTTFREYWRSWNVSHNKKIQPTQKTRG